MKNDLKVITAILTLPLSILLPTNVMGADTIEAEPNNTIGAAQNIDSHFSVGVNPDIQDSAIWPWVSIGADGDGTNDYYSFEVPAAGVTGVFDIDYGIGGGLVDTKLCLYTATGTLLVGNDDSLTSAGAGGSTSVFDSFISYEFAIPGTYVIGVGQFPALCNPGGIAGSALHNGVTYELQVSLSQQVVDTDGDGVADDFDCNPYSDLNPTVVFEGCDSGVANMLFADGCTIADLTHACADDAKNHGKFSSCVTAVTKNLVRNGEISGSGKVMIQSCAAQSDINKKSDMQ
jgi:hypothetical protein